MRRADDPSAGEDPDDEFVERFEVPSRPRIGLIVGAALTAGVMIGASVPFAAHWLAPAHKAPAIAAEVRVSPPRAAQPADPQPAQAAAAEPTAPVDVPSPPTVAPEPSRPAHRAAARAPRPAHAAPIHVAKASVDVPCRLGESQADYQVCAFPMVAAADQDLQRAYREARSAGVPQEQLKADEAAWQQARETASHRSATELEIAYRTRIAHVEALASEAPH
jgi:uncharacterized protein YecT (DUF1311 family)